MDKSVVPPRAWAYEYGDKVQQTKGFAYWQKETNHLVEAPTWIDLVREVKKHRVANVLPIGLGFERELESQIASKLQAIGVGHVVEPYAPPVKYPLPREEWPTWAKGIAMLGNKTDKGVGSTIERIIGPFGGDAFKAWHQKIFNRECHCTQRREQWDFMYAY